MSDQQVQAKLADLKIQAMIFDMDIDIETWSLIPKSDYKEPYWLSRWKAKQEERDYMDIDDQGYDE